MKINRGTGPSSSPKPESQRPTRREPVPEQPQHRAYDVTQDGGFDDPEPEEEEEVVVKKRRFPVGLLVVVIILALVAFAGWNMLQFYGEVDGK